MSKDVQHHSLPRVTLDEISESIVDGPFGSNLKTSDYVQRGVPVLQGKNITGNRFVWKDVRYISEEKARQLSRSATILGDHLLIKIGSIGFSAILNYLNGHDKAIIPANLARIRPNRSKINDQYLHRVLTSDTVVRHFQKVASKTAQPALSLKKIKATKIPLPPLPEQKRIAAILDAADGLRTKRHESIRLLNDLIQSTFLEMFGDPVTNPMGWEISQLGELCLMKSGGTPSRKNPEFFKGNVPWITTPTLGARYVGYDCANELITEKAIDSSATKLIPAGSILIGVRVGVGKVSIASCDICTNQDIISLVNLSELLSPDFLRYQIATYEEFLASQKRGATIQGIVSNSLKKLLVYIPPFDLQNQFANIVQSIEDQKTRLQSHVNELDTLFASLQQRAFNGEL